MRRYRASSFRSSKAFRYRFSGVLAKPGECHPSVARTKHPIAHRHFSKDSSHQPESVEHCSKTLTWMGEHIAAEETLAAEWARKLSPAARKELAHVRSESKLASGAHRNIPEPSRAELHRVALSQAIPFVGFGFMDNAILIVAGDAIDTSLGVILGISTMCAAAIGNIVSDVAGIMLGTVIEDFSARLGLPTPNVSAAQRTLRSVRFASQFGCGAGIVIGCIIGMFPLLLIDSNKVQKMKQEAHMDQIFRDVVTEAKGLVGALATRMFLVVDTPESKMPSSLDLEHGGDQYLYGRYVTGSAAMAEESRLKLGRGIVSRAVLTGESVNVYDVQTEPDFAREIWQKMDSSTIKNMVCVPVFDSTGRVIAVIQAINKVGKGIADDDDQRQQAGFTESDVQLLKVLASHLSVSLQSMYEDDAELTLRDTMKVLKEHGLSGFLDETMTTGRNMPRKLFPEA